MVVGVCLLYFTMYRNECIEGIESQFFVYRLGLLWDVILIGLSIHFVLPCIILGGLLYSRFSFEDSYCQLNVCLQFYCDS